MKCHYGYKCNICQENFKTDTALASHYLDSHNGNHARCEACKTEFKYKKGLNKHMKNGNCKVIALVEESTSIGKKSASWIL